MAETLALQAAFFFAISHILIRRGLEKSNSITASVISLGLTALTTWVMVPFMVQVSSFWTPAVGYFVAAGLFAPGLGRIFNYMGIERVGVARTVPVSNSSPMFASVLAVLFLGERWTLQNVTGTSLVIAGLVILSQARPERTEWRGVDLIYPLLAALSFAISSVLRKRGLIIANLPVMAAALAAATAFLFVIAMLQAQGGRKVLKLTRRSAVWLFIGGLTNTAATLSVFYALSYGKVVIVEPLVATNPLLSILLAAIFLRDLEAITPRVVVGGLCTVIGTILVVTL